MALHNILGRLGESEAAKYLKGKGLRILETNWKIGDLETDIIAQDGETIVFVEVKTRSEGGVGNPEDAVDLERQRRLTIGAQAYLRKEKLDNPWRFDIIAIVKGENKTEINHIIDAFLPPTRTIGNGSFSGDHKWVTKEKARKKK